MIWTKHLTQLYAGVSTCKTNILTGSSELFVPSPFEMIFQITWVAKIYDGPLSTFKFGENDGYITI